ncbi:hypothetical protein M501DRAFT_439574 [Patellaria atrata CBS 101060]|uniref:Uncharacterized protein n=1 Tax=Patellaria atrata CBS 101060 TaxID=1346257 RepID=A0A9P4VMT4_9PEZI|nr:hypothetical protein M501DRAFT_439574 [Patellaria atrata CBS 101060]
MSNLDLQDRKRIVCNRSNVIRRNKISSKVPILLPCSQKNSFSYFFHLGAHSTSTLVSIVCFLCLSHLYSPKYPYSTAVTHTHN